MLIKLPPLTMLNKCQYIIHMFKSKNLLEDPNMTPDELFNYNSKGELFHVFYMFYEALRMDNYIIKIDPTYGNIAIYKNNLSLKTEFENMFNNNEVNNGKSS